MGMRWRDKDHVAWGSQPQNQASTVAANQGDIDCEMWLPRHREEGHEHEQQYQRERERALKRTTKI